MLGAWSDRALLGVVLGATAVVAAVAALLLPGGSEQADQTAVRSVKVTRAAELDPKAYRDAIIFTAAGSDVAAGRLSWAASGVASNRRVTADSLVTLAADDVLIGQPYAPRGLRYVRVDRRGRLSRPVGSMKWPGQSRVSEPETHGDLAVGPDGRIVLVSGAAVWRIAGDGRPSLLLRASDDQDGFAGVAVLPNGDVLAADVGKDEIVRIGRDRAETVLVGATAGGSDHRGDGERGANVVYTLGPIAAFPDGSFVFARGRPYRNRVVRRVDANGQIVKVVGGGPRTVDERCVRRQVRGTSVRFQEIVDLLALPGGDFLLSDIFAGVWHVSRRGRLTQILCSESGRAKRFDTNVDGRRASHVIVGAADSLAVTRDGTLLIAGGKEHGEFFVSMLQPRGGRRLAVALAPLSHATITHDRLVIAATHRARVAIRVVQRKRTLFVVRAKVRAGRTVLALGHRVPAGEIDVFMTATAADGRVAADRLRTIIPGQRGLAVAAVRRLILRRVRRESSSATVSRCRVVARGAVACQLRDNRSDYFRREHWTVSRTPDGLIHARVDDDGDVESYVMQP